MGSHSLKSSASGSANCNERTRGRLSEVLYTDLASVLSAESPSEQTGTRWYRDSKCPALTPRALYELREMGPQAWSVSHDARTHLSDTRRPCIGVFTISHRSGARICGLVRVCHLFWQYRESLFPSSVPSIPDAVPRRCFLRRCGLANLHWSRHGPRIRGVRFF